MKRVCAGASVGEPIINLVCDGSPSWKITQAKLDKGGHALKAFDEIVLRRESIGEV